ncbi:dolichyl-phosphate-mannose--protein mannosyltransferase [Croceivirga lutea]|uniref:ArnT family glycosyltransferase n=1 Tax=Croceivirga lutea TaxID=1775167 RepID=UPI00163B0AA7|nr:glycosyltransferase family 39 protein [Croceivirga lutea]GGG56318.1 dolichyl-phosphate-mannose--protein mannosyltransferase [Croceivirga lutea]
MQTLYKYDYLVVFLLSLVSCVLLSGIYPIYILDEARNSEAAREMLVSGDYIVPYFNGQLRTDKPPLHYYFMIVGYKLFGVNAFGARFFSGIFGAFTILITYVLTKQNLGKGVANYTFLVLLSSLLFIQEFHLAVPDPYLIFFISASLFSFYEFFKQGKLYILVLAYISIGLGLLTKGPVAIVIPGLVLVAFLFFSKNFTLKKIFSFRPLLGLLFAILIAAPWYYLVHQKTQGIWTEGFFFDHNISRFNSGKEGHGGLFIITPLFVILGLLPFSVFIIQAFRNGWIKGKKNNFLLFSFVVGVVTILFFSIASTKLPNYPMPSYPFIAILIGKFLHEVARSNSKSKYSKLSMLCLLVISLLLPIAGFIGLGLEKDLKHLQNFALLLSVISIGAILGYYFFLKGDLKRFIIFNAFGWIFFSFLLFGIIYPVLSLENPVSQTSKFMNSETPAIVFKRFDSAFPFNFKRTYRVVDDLTSLQKFLNENPDGYIITNTRSKEDIDLLSNFNLVMEQKALFETHVTRIYKK